MKKNMKTLRWSEVTVGEMAAANALGYECVVDGDTQHVFVFDRADSEGLLGGLVESVW